MSKTIKLFCALSLIGASGGCGHASLVLTEIPLPKLTRTQVLKPRKQTTPPKELTNNPFVDPAPIITPTKIEKNRGFVLFSRPITKPVYKATNPRPWERCDRIATFATSGEYEPLTFSLYPLRETKDLRIAVSSLRSDDGAVIPETALDLRAVTNWNLRYPRYSSKGAYRSQPELLEKVNCLDLTKGVCQRFWIKIHVPENAQPGLYQGGVIIYATGEKKALRLPITLRVLDYKLISPPDKRYSVYYYPPKYQFKGLKGATLEKARMNELKAMRSYGIDMFPTISLGTKRTKNKKIELYLRDDKNIEAMLKMGFKGPMPVCGGIWSFYTTYVPGGKIGKHWHISKQPPNNKVYKAITAAFADLKQRAAAKGWPEMVVCPMDEVAPSTKEFAAKVLLAIRKAGVKTYTTKDPTAADAAEFRKIDAVNAWCSQPFAYSYDKVMADKKHEYWTYPNHNAGEIKNRVVMQKGGRMTYGYGLWKSGYSTVIPWHWRWLPNRDDQFDYLRGRPYSGCGARMDENQQIIPAVYWECFREGRDDLRYLYTLETAVVQREGSKNPHCRELVAEGKKLLREIWNSIPPEKKYLKVSYWSDENFLVRRWQMASLTQKLLAYQATNKKRPSSVPDFVRTPSKHSETTASNLLTKGLKNGWIDRLNLGEDNYKHWRAVNKEASKKVIPGNPATLQFKVDVDYEIDGGGEKGKYPIGWPRISRNFTKGTLDLTKYDYLSFKVKVDSNRSEVEDDVTPFIINFASYAKGVRYDSKMDFGDKPRIWLSERLSISDMIAKSGFPKYDWKNLKIIQLVIAESHYADKTKLVFDIRDLALLKFNRPILRTIVSSDVIMRTDKNVVIKADGYGLADLAKRNYSLVLTVANSDHKKVFTGATSMTNNPKFMLDASKIAPGAYTLKLTILDSNGSKLSSISKKITLINGFE